MTKFRARNISDLIIAAVAGALLAVSFPKTDISWLAWFALVPLLLVMSRRPFLSGMVAGVSFFAITLYWLNIVMVTYGHLHPLLALCAYLLLVFYLALFFAAPIWLACRLRDRPGYPLSLTLPVLWIAAELLRSVLLTGFPWVLLGYSQHQNLHLVQSVDLFGVYGISGLIILSNCVICALVTWLRYPQRRFVESRYIIVFILLMLANFGYGLFKLDNLPSAATDFSVALVQGNIDQSLKWAPDNQRRTVDIYTRLTQQASAANPDLVIWPESATPFYLQEDSDLHRAVVEIPRRMASTLLTGSPAYEPDEKGGYRYFNSAFLISPEGKLDGRSDKVHLVPFGEYVPLKQFFPFIDKLVYGIGDFSAGEVRTLQHNKHHFGVLVCYEAIFPELARAYTKAGSSLLINITNDAWFGHSSAPYQHLAMARFRAIENRRWLARSANTGISALIDPGGHITTRSGLFEEATLDGNVQLLETKTFYTRFGDILPLVFMLVAVAWFWQSRLRK